MVAASTFQRYLSDRDISRDELSARVLNPKAPYVFAQRLRSLSKATQEFSPLGAEDRIEARDLVPRIEGALQRLPPTQREVVLLSRYAGLDTEEIAQVTGQTPGAVRATLPRALQLFRALLGE